MEFFGRRRFLQSGAALGILPLAWGGDKAADGLPVCPLKPVYEDRFDTLVAIVNAQIDALWCGKRGDNPCEVAKDILTYAKHLPRRLQHGISVALLWLDFYSIKKTGRSLAKHSPAGLRRVLNQGETIRRQGDPPLILWNEDHLLHTAVSGLAMLGRLVIHSRPAARRHIGLGWSEQCNDVNKIVAVAPYPLADLSVEYDVCIIGSGAGGATVADRMSAAGYRVLILDTGDFVSPDALVKRETQPDGSTILAPPRSDEVLYKLYKDGAGQIAGGLSNKHSKLDLLLPHRRKKIAPKQTVNVAQAQVFGGGPYVNNAIHLPIPPEVYESWADRQPTDMPYGELNAIMNQVSAELGVNTQVTSHQISDRSIRFKEGAEAIGEQVLPLPVSIRRNCMGCGSDNSVDSFGDHIGGVHPLQENEPNSFLTNAMHAPVSAQASYRTRAERVLIRRNEAGGLDAYGVRVVRREEDGSTTRCTIRAKQYVVAAGVGASTKLVSDSLRHAGLCNRELGKRLTANIGTAMYAMYDKPIWPSGSGNPEPGVTQCFLVDRRMIHDESGNLVEEPALENWFHFPGTVALALTGWFQDFACVMKRFNHLSMAGIVIPTQVRRQNHVDRCGGFHLEYNREEFELLLRGMRRIARIYFAAAKPDDGVSLYLPTKAILLRHGRPLKIRSMEDFEWALQRIRCNGPAFLNLLSTHPQGGNSIGGVVDAAGMRVTTDCGGMVNNMVVADASTFPAGCEINPQLTVKALATIAANRLADRMNQSAA
ncbi:MAG: GMC family oxidoreductase N-terminal domain-containing protein [Planctomycetota bacterium]